MNAAELARRVLEGESPLGALRAMGIKGRNLEARVLCQVQDYEEVFPDYMDIFRVSPTDIPKIQTVMDLAPFDPSLADTYVTYEFYQTEVADRLRDLGIQYRFEEVRFEGDERA